MPKKLLLVHPKTPPSFWGMEYALEIARLSASNPPLGLITVAALTPPDWEVALVDENVEPVDLDAACDVVGIGAMNVQARRAFELADAFRQRGRTVVIGGPLTFSHARRCAPHADVVVVGEAERTWPRFCADYAAGRQAPIYLETEPVDMALSPVPRYDLLVPHAYAAIPIQSSRGCPHNCEFCDIIVMLGRRVRTKSVEQVMAEVDAVAATGTDSIFFTDDNFNGNLKYVRAMLNALIEKRRLTGYAPLLFTQASVDLAEQDDLLELMVRAGFTRLFLGVETPNQAALREANKRQNLHGNLLDRIHKLQRAGLVTWAGMIVGFDHDTPDIFAEQAEFLDQAGIAMAMVGLLNAVPRTALYERLQRERRLIETTEEGDNCAWTNIVPKQMSRAELFRGYADLLSHLYDQRNYTRRLLKNIFNMQPAQSGQTASRPPSLADLADMFRAIWYFTWRRDPVYRRHFVPNLLRVACRRFSRVVEACVHLGIWPHFDRYVPRVREALERGALLEAVQQVHLLAPPLAAGAKREPLAAEIPLPPAVERAFTEAAK
ncbi:MAG: B12-binding domain-containing radical SAM protein [Deltaproteobacteria bacterium]|nr:B12-binding domain-containing radical SAM protein [Deltaproteobacteria bacterium]